MNVEVLLFDVSNWQEMETYQTGGTRAKCWLLNPNDQKLYFFKKSHKKDAIDYRSEFWMEIIASKFGQSLGLNVLDYNVAKKDDELGCLSSNMCGEKEELVELMRLLTAFDPMYNPGSRDDQKKYTFDFLCKSLDNIGLLKYIRNFIEVLIFDSIIGNQDRHQENWGFIKPTGAVVDVEKNYMIFKTHKNVDSWNFARFAPIYDSGSCLGRELPESKIQSILNNQIAFESYVNRGKAELRWINDKIQYLSLIELLITSTDYSKETKSSIQKILEKYDTDVLKSIVFSVDSCLSNEDLFLGISDIRKNFVFKLIEYRFNLLKKLYIKYEKA